MSDCLPCTGGYYCAGNGLTSPTGLCAAGYYCPDNETISSATPSSFVCPANYKCPEGSAKPEPCPSGEFQANMGMSVCSKCPAGFYCNTTGNVPIKYDCPPFHYCPEGELYLHGYYSYSVASKFLFFLLINKYISFNFSEIILAYQIFQYFIGTDN